MELINKVADNLYWGGQPLDINDYKFVVALNHCPRYHINEGTMVVVSPLQDGYKIPNEQRLHYLADLVNLFASQGKTLVHCTQGINRSSLIIALALIKRGEKPRDVVKKLRAIRGSDVLCNEVFEEWLVAPTEE